MSTQAPPPPHLNVILLRAGMAGLGEYILVRTEQLECTTKGRRRAVPCPIYSMVNIIYRGSVDYNSHRHTKIGVLGYSLLPEIYLVLVWRP
jgi:hypothetical protein